MPKENPIQYKRSFPAAHKFFLSEIMLYIHFRDEEAEIKPNDLEFIEDLYKRNFERIRKIKIKVMEHLHDVEEARHYVEETKKKIDLSNITVNLNAAGEQENAGCQEESVELHPDYIHLEPEHDYKIKDNMQHQNIYRTIDLPDISILKENTTTLTETSR